MRNVKNKKHLAKALILVGEKYVQEVKSQLSKEDNVATGNLIKSVAYKIVEEGVQIETSRYGQTIDAGSSPSSRGFGRVSRDFKESILEWARAKGISPKNGPKTEGNMRKMAYAIASKIQRDGVMGSQIFDRVYNRLEKEFGETLMEAYSKDLTEQLNNIKSKK